MTLKTILTTISLFFFIPFLNAGSCYEAWDDAYTEATTEYALDITRCRRAVSPIRCNQEAEASYAYALNEASNDYHACLSVG